MNARAYYLDLQHIIHTSPYVASADIRFEEIDVNECYVSGSLTLAGGYVLHIAEYIVTAPVLTRPKYRYHLQTPAGQLVSRWDNAPHHPEVPTFPDHRHDSLGKPYPSRSMNIPDILVDVPQLIEVG